MMLRSFLVWSALLLGAVPSAVPSPAAFHPMATHVLCWVDDDQAGSGFEVTAAPRKNGSRRHGLRLRVRSDAERANLLRETGSVAQMLDECFPECGGDLGLARALQPIILASYEGRKIDAEGIVAESGLSAERARASLSRLLDLGLVTAQREAATGATRLAIVLAEATAARSRAVVDRLYEKLAVIINGA